MAQLTPAAELIAGLKAEGWNYTQIGKALGINGSLVRQAIAPSKGQRQKPLTKYVGALKELQGKKPGAAPSKLPGKRTTKSGATAKVRKGTKTVTTKKGVQQTITTVKKGPTTLKSALRDAASKNKQVRWSIHFKKLKTYPDRPPAPGYASTNTLSWNARTLLDRIDNPQPGDGWRAGDVNGALIALVRAENPKILSASGADEFNLFTTDN